MKKGLYIIVALIIIVVAFLGYSVVFGGGTYITENPKDYYDFTSHNENGIMSDLYIFPKKIYDNTQKVKYYYLFSDTFLDTTYQIYLDCVYEDNEFELEKNRIKSLNYEKNKISFDEQNFSLPAYVARLGYDCTSEYVLIDEQENRIIYIYLQFAKKEDIGFDLSLLPNNYKSYGECNASYSLY